MKRDGNLEARKYVRIILNIMIPLFVIYAVCFWGPRLLAFFLPFVIGAVIAMIANPLVHFLEKNVKIVRKHSSIVMIVGVLALVIAGLYFLIAWLFREMRGFITALPGLYETMVVEVKAAYGALTRYFNFLPTDLDTTFAQILAGLETLVGDSLQDMAAMAGGAVARTLPDALVYTIVMLMSSYLFLTEHDRIRAGIRKNLPAPVLKYLRLFRGDLKTVIGGYFVAQFKIMFVIAAVLLAGLMILGVKYCIFLAIGIAILDFLPMFGTGTVLIPWALVKLCTGEFAYAAGLGALYVMTQAVRQVIQPKIVGDSMGLKPLPTLFLLFLGFKFRGIAGMILAVPVGLVFIKFYEYGAFDSLIRNVKLLVKEIGDLRKEEDEE